MMARLGDVCAISASAKENPDEYVWLLNLDMVEQQTGRILQYVYVPKEEAVGSIIRFDTDNVLYSKLRPNLNKVVLPTKDGFATSELLPLRPDSTILCKEYLATYLRSGIFVAWATSKATGAKMPRLASQELLNKTIPLPSLAEQKRIASVIEAIDNLISLHKRQLAKLDELVKARFVELFGHPDLNEKGWEIIPLGNLCSIVRGGSPRPITDFLGGTVPWIKIGDATIGDNIYLHSTKERIIPEGIKKSRMVKAGSLIFANCGVSLGFARIITFDGCIHDGWLAMESIDSSLNKVFLLQCLNQMTEHFRAIAPAGTQPNLNTAIMNAHMQIVPPMEMQKAFVDFVDKTAKFRLTIRQGLDKMETLKRALMQEYFG